VLRAGTLNAGTRDDAPPFAFRDKDGTVKGFSVDLIEAIRAAVARHTGQSIATRLLIVTTQTRLGAIETGAADLVCETATITWARQQRVDFSLPIFRDGTRIMGYRERLSHVADPASLRIGVVEGAVTARLLEEAWPGVTPLPFPSMPAALDRLQAGELDAIANVGVVLRGLMAGAERKAGLMILPRGDALGYETLACALPPNDSEWRNLVNGALLDLLRGIGEYRGGYYEIYQRWFGRDAALPYPLDAQAARFLRNLRIWLD
jgi:polar amino acid transport system substrate-binding protein